MSVAFGEAAAKRASRRSKGFSPCDGDIWTETVFVMISPMFLFFAFGRTDTQTQTQTNAHKHDT